MKVQAYHRSIRSNLFTSDADIPNFLSSYLCAWGNVTVNEVKPRRDNCWLKTFSIPERVSFGSRSICAWKNPRVLPPQNTIILRRVDDVNSLLLKKGYRQISVGPYCTC